MIAAFARLLTGPIVDRVADLWKAHLDKAVSEQELRAEVAKAVTDAIAGVPAAQAPTAMGDRRRHRSASE